MADQKIETVTLDNICGGALPEIFARELTNILKNIEDPNSDVDKKRTLTMELLFVPFSDRSGAVVELRCKTKMPGFPTQQSTVFIGRHEGQIVAIPKDAGQNLLFGEKQPKSENVVDMKKGTKLN